MIHVLFAGLPTYDVLAASQNTRDSHFSHLLGSLGREADEYGVILQAKGCNFGLIKLPHGAASEGLGDQAF